MDRDELKVILEVHKIWLETKDTNKVFGKCADLSGMDLSYVDLKGANLSNIDLHGANLSGANLRGANLCNTDLCWSNLRGANLRGADLRGADLRRVDLRNANLYGADLRRVDLRGANLRGADLRYSDLSDTDLHGANLRGADLIEANLTNVKYDDTTKFFSMICPEDGSFVGYKKAKNNTIVELLIPKDALRSSATTNKCRCSKAKVLSIVNIDGSEYAKCYVRSNYDKKFIYKVGEVVEVKDFDIDRWNECSTGIHFFMTRDEAVNY